MTLFAQASILHSRNIEQIIVGRPTSDGAGVRLTRVLGQNLQQRLDPFLMLDEFGSRDAVDYLGGFPDHPHRGFETVTYMLNGRMRHRDSAGNEGLLENGDLQWMTAGRGIIHSEMPEQEEGLMRGFQLWVNLPAKDKMTGPAYQDIKSAQIPQTDLPFNVRVRILAGEFGGKAGAVQRPNTEPLYLDVQLPAAQLIDLPIAATHNAFIYVYEGAVMVGAQQQPLRQQQMGLLANYSAADGVRLQATQDARLILVAGKPLREPIVQYGPFVMNTPAQIAQAINDYQSGILER